MEKGNQQTLLRRVDALRFYGGDTRKRCSNGYMGIKSEDTMFGDKNAYRTLNALLFEGIKNEQERIWTESCVECGVYQKDRRNGAGLYRYIYSNEGKKCRFR